MDHNVKSTFECDLRFDICLQVMDLMHRLTDATEDRDEALEAAAREWQLAELLRQQLAGEQWLPFDRFPLSLPACHRVRS